MEPGLLNKVPTRTPNTYHDPSSNNIVHKTWCFSKMFILRTNANSVTLPGGLDWAAYYCTPLNILISIWFNRLCRFVTANVYWNRRLYKLSQTWWNTPLSYGKGAWKLKQWTALSKKNKKSNKKIKYPNFHFCVYLKQDQEMIDEDLYLYNHGWSIRHIIVQIPLTILT